MRARIVGRERGMRDGGGNKAKRWLGEGQTLRVGERLGNVTIA
jgi:hypothetical protein